MRRLTLTILFVFAACVTLIASDWANVYATLKDNHVVELRIDNAYRCTGVIIKVDTIISAAHCIIHEDMVAQVVEVVNRFEQAIPTKLVRLSTALDLALLTATLPNHTPIKLATLSPPSATEVIAVGFHTSNPSPDATVAHVLQMFPDRLIVDQPYQYGYSGGPLVNSKLELVGINVRTDFTRGIGLSVPIELVRWFLGD